MHPIISLKLKFQYVKLCYILTSLLPYILPHTLIGALT